MPGASNNLIESATAADSEWFRRFVSDRAKISRKISAKRSARSSGTVIMLQTPLAQNFVCPRARFLIGGAQLLAWVPPTLFGS